MARSRITKREWVGKMEMIQHYATAALQGLLANSSVSADAPKAVVTAAFDHAEEMVGMQEERYTDE